MNDFTHGDDESTLYLVKFRSEYKYWFM